MDREFKMPGLSNVFWKGVRSDVLHAISSSLQSINLTRILCNIRLTIYNILDKVKLLP